MPRPRFVSQMDRAVKESVVGRFFDFEGRNAKFSTEVVGATATFLTMAYILAVNPRILAESGGPCTADDELGGIFSDEYLQCIESVKREYVTSTALASAVGCLMMGLLANLPIALAPGMGINAYFTYSVVGWRGVSFYKRTPHYCLRKALNSYPKFTHERHDVVKSGAVSYQAAVTAILIEGFIFLVLALTGIRFALVKLIPEPVKVATPAAIGFFLAHIGLQTAEGIGIVVSDIATAVTLGACPPESRTPIVAFTDACQSNTDLCVTADAYTCDVAGGVMASPTTWMGLLGLFIMAILLAYKSKWSFILGIGFITITSWFRNTPITYFPDTAMGDDRFDYFSKVVSVEPLDKLVAPFTGNLQAIGLALFTFLYVDFLDSSGTLLGLARAMGLMDEKGDFPRSRWAFTADAIATIFGSLFGLSPVTAYIESGSGVRLGSKTGLTAIIVAFYFVLSVFLSPIFASIPPWASGGALILVGAHMAEGLTEIKWHLQSHALSATVTILTMVLTYSIAYGLLFGIGTFVVMEAFFWLVHKIFGFPTPFMLATEDEDEMLPVKNGLVAAGESCAHDEADAKPGQVGADPETDVEGQQGIDKPHGIEEEQVA